jgi:hypothetical protein
MKLFRETPSKPPPFFHTCFAQCDVELGAFLENAIMESCTLDDPQDATLFDAWIHRLCYAASSSYNRI